MEGIIIWVLIVIGIAVFNGLFSKSDEETAYEQRKEIFDKIRLATAKDRALAGEGLDAYVFDSISSVQLGHRFKLSGITEGFATPSKEFAKGTVINNYNQIQEIYSLSGALQDQYIAFAHEDIFLDDDSYFSVFVSING